MTPSSLKACSVFPKHGRTASSICLALFLSVALAQGAFAAWSYDSGARTLTDSASGWVLATDGEVGSLTVTGSTAGSGGDVDLASANADCSVSVTAIGNGAFGSQASLVSITLPETLTTIGSESFFFCTSLSSVFPLLPDSVTSVGTRAFYWCTALTGKLTLSNPEAVLHGDESLAGEAFVGTRLVDGELNVPALPANTFWGCGSLTNVVFAGDRLKSVGSHAFNQCGALRMVSPFLPDTVTNVGERAFYACAALGGKLRLAHPNAAISGGEVFPMTAIVDAELNVPALPAYTFWGCGGLTNVVFAGDRLKSVGNYAFNQCVTLRTVSPFLPDTVTNVGERAFYLCTSLRGKLELTHPNAGINGVEVFPLTAIAAAELNIPALPAYTFWGCGSLTNVVFTSRRLTSIGELAFCGNALLRDLYFHGSVPAPGSMAASAWRDIPSRQVNFHIATSQVPDTSSIPFFSQLTPDDVASSEYAALSPRPYGALVVESDRRHWVSNWKSPLACTAVIVVR